MRGPGDRRNDNAGGVRPSQRIAIVFGFGGGCGGPWACRRRNALLCRGVPCAICVSLRRACISKRTDKAGDCRNGSRSTRARRYYHGLSADNGSQRQIAAIAEGLGAASVIGRRRGGSARRRCLTLNPYSCFGRTSELRPRCCGEPWSLRCCSLPDICTVGRKVGDFEFVKAPFLACQLHRGDSGVCLTCVLGVADTDE